MLLLSIKQKKSNRRFDSYQFDAMLNIVSLLRNSRQPQIGINVARVLLLKIRELEHNTTDTGDNLHCCTGNTASQT